MSQPCSGSGVSGEKTETLSPSDGVGLASRSREGSGDQRVCLREGGGSVALIQGLLAWTVSWAQVGRKLHLYCCSAKPSISFCD